MVNALTYWRYWIPDSQSWHWVRPPDTDWLLHLSCNRPTFWTSLTSLDLQMLVLACAGLIILTVAHRIVSRPEVHPVNTVDPTLTNAHPPTQELHEEPELLRTRGGKGSSCGDFDPALICCHDSIRSHNKRPGYTSPHNWNG